MGERLVFDAEFVGEIDPDEFYDSDLEGLAVRDPAGTELGTVVQVIHGPGGDHLAVRRWRRQAALEKTLRNRPDLLSSAVLSKADLAFLASLGYKP